MHFLGQSEGIPQDGQLRDRHVPTSAQQPPNSGNQWHHVQTSAIESTSRFVDVAAPTSLLNYTIFHIP
jgi:hypothetical protein